MHNIEESNESEDHWLPDKSRGFWVPQSICVSPYNYCEKNEKQTLQLLSLIIITTKFWFVPKKLIVCLYKQKCCSKQSKQLRIIYNHFKSIYAVI